MLHSLYHCLLIRFEQLCACWLNRRFLVACNHGLIQLSSCSAVQYLPACFAVPLGSAWRCEAQLCHDATGTSHAAIPDTITSWQQVLPGGTAAVRTASETAGPSAATQGTYVAASALAVTVPGQQQDPATVLLATKPCSPQAPVLDAAPAGNAEEPPGIAASQEDQVKGPWDVDPSSGLSHIAQHHRQ